jgi:predicted GIY-YIG superfamily endonuclease
MRARPKRDPQQTAQCVYRIPRESGRSYTGETGRPLAVRLCEHRHNPEQSFLEKSKLGQLVYKEGHTVGWDDARILETESNNRYRKSWNQPR